MVILIIILVWVLVIFEKGFCKFVLFYLDNLVILMFFLFIVGFLVFIVIGLFGCEVGSLIFLGLIWLYNSLGFVGGVIFGIFYVLIVIMGMY